MRVNTRYINSTRGTSSGVLLLAKSVKFAKRSSTKTGEEQNAWPYVQVHGKVCGDRTACGLWNGLLSK